MSSRAPITTSPCHGLATTALEPEGLFVEPLELESKQGSTPNRKTWQGVYETKSLGTSALRQSCDTSWEANIDSVKAEHTQFEHTRTNLKELINVNDYTAVSETKNSLDSIKKCQSFYLIVCQELFFMNSVASTLNRVTGMEFNNQISVLTPNNWNTWKHDMQVLLMHYGCWQFIVQTKPEKPDEEATYKEKLDLQLRKDRCYTLIYTNISSDLKNLITETTDGVAAWKILKDHFEPVTRAREFQSTVQQIYRWKEEDFRVVKIEAELILEANRLQLMKQDLEKAENAYLSSFTSKKSKTLPGATAAAHGDPNGKNDYQKRSDLKPITNMKMSLATEDKSCPVEGIGTLRFRMASKYCLSLVKFPISFGEKHYFVSLMRAKMGIMMGYAQRTKGYRIWLIDENKLVETINVRFDENKRGINFRQKVNSNLGYNLNLPDYYDDEDDFDRVKDSLTSRLVSKTSTETPSTSEKPDVSSDNHSLIPCTEVKWIRNIGRKVTGSNKDNTESQGFSDLSEQQEALMVEVTIPNCYKQAIRSRDASKWHDAMDKEINVMMERKVWDLVDHPDNIKILENRWVYTIKYDENNKIVRYKPRLVARGNTQLRGESFDEVFQEYKLELSKVKSLKLRCYSDSDFATTRDDRVSMGGFITFIDETPISSRTFKQKSVSLSTMEAEYVSLTEAAKEFIWLKNVIDNKSLNLELSENVMFCDNQAATSYSKSPVEN
ncbi:hypothetical protein TNCV_3478941 [Trichonephila clavipes]|nr:hypothetical protein TNCV_3478941 [Trichonephila clavipes]